jgi:hypothetical protein
MMTEVEVPPLLDVTKWDDLFSACGDKDANLKPGRAGLMRVGPHFNMRGCHGNETEYQFGKVQPTQLVLDRLASYIVVGTDCGPMYFELLVFDNTIDVHVKYNQILGVHFLATIEKSSVPAGFLELK